MKERKRFAPGALTAPLPPVIVTVGAGDEVNMITIGWTGILATQPPKTYISVRPTRHSYALLKKYPEFVINLPTASLAREVDFIGIYTGAKLDKFERTGLTAVKSEKVAAPTIAECPVALECRVCEVIPMGSHDVFVADIVSVSASDDIIDEAGRICFDRAGLLAYAHGEYFALGEKLGKFGFSTEKAKKGGTRVAKNQKNIAREPKKREADESRKEIEKAPTGPEPFYKNAPRVKSKKKPPSDKNKGAPHGKRAAKGK